MRSDAAGAAFESLISDQLEQERKRKDSLEQRGVFVITSSGAVVTLLLALGAAVAGGSMNLSVGGSRLLAVSITLLMGAACLGLAVNWPITYGEPHADWLSDLMVKKLWEDPQVVGSLAVSKARLITIEHFRKQNQLKAKLLVRALACEVGALTTMSIVVAILVIA